MTGIFWLIVTVLDIIAIIDIVKSALPGGKKVLWIVLIVLIPFIGLILYYLLGKKKA